MDRERMIQIKTKCKKFLNYMKYSSLVVLTFFYLQNQFFGWSIQSNLVYKINAVAGCFQIFVLSLFMFIEEGSIEKLKTTVTKKIFNDWTTLIMALPTILLILSDQLLVSSKVLPVFSKESASNYSLPMVAVLSILVLKKRMFLSQLLAIAFVVKGLSFFTVTLSSVNYTESISIPFYAYLTIVFAIFCNGFATIIIEKVLKSSETHIWIRGLQLNLFIVPLSLLMIILKGWLNGESTEIFGEFNIIAWFFVIFKAAQQVMELFVLKICSSIHKCLSFAVAFVMMGIMRNPFTLDSSYEDVPAKGGTGLVLAGVCLYTILDHCFSKKTVTDVDNSENYEYQEPPLEPQGYQVIEDVPIINADPYLKFFENNLEEEKEH